MTNSLLSKNYLLKPKIHRVKYDHGIYYVQFKNYDGVIANHTSAVRLTNRDYKLDTGGECKEIKRGWIVHLHFVYHRPVKIFLDRRYYDKIEVETYAEVQTILNKL